MNERRVADERKTLEERKAIFDRTKLLADQSFADQIKLVEGFTGERLALNELVLIDDERIIRERLRQRDLDDVSLGRILEIIRERKLLTQDIADLERDLTDAITERKEEQIAATQEQVDTINEIEQTQLQGQIDDVQRRFEAEKEGSANRLALLDEEFKLRKRKLEDQADFEKLNDETTAEDRELIQANLQNELDALEAQHATSVEDVNKDILEAEKTAAAKRSAELQDALTDFADEFANFFKELSDKRLEVIDRELETTQSNIERLEALAAEGSEDAKNNIANEIKEEAELRAAREEEIQNQKTLELGLAALKSFSANVDAGDNNALGSTISQVTALLSFIGSLSGFYEGTENVAASLGKPSLNGRDGYVIRVDGKERIMNPSDNAMIPKGMDNHTVALLARDHGLGLMSSMHHPSDISAVTPVLGYQSGEQMIHALDRVEQAIKDKPFIDGSWLDPNTGEIVTAIIKKGHKTLHRRKLPKWA